MSELLLDELEDPIIDGPVFESLEGAADAELGIADGDEENDGKLLVESGLDAAERNTFGEDSLEANPLASGEVSEDDEEDL